MELDPIKLLCSGNPLDALIATLKKKLKEAIAASMGKINATILSIRALLKDALMSLIPQTSEKPAFLIELMELKSKIGGAISEFNAAAAALIAKWGKVIGNIQELINSLANLSICDLLMLNFKMNPDGSIVLDSPPPKTPVGPPEISSPAPVTTTNNLPTDFSKKTSAAVDGGNAITKTIEDSELFQLKISADSNLSALVSLPVYSSFESKCRAQGGISLSDTNVQNLTPLEKTVQEDYIVYSRDIEEIKVAINACKSSCIRINEQLLQLIKQNNGKISSEDVASILSTLPSLINAATSHTLKTPSIASATESTAKSLQSVLTSQWKAIAERSAMQININTIEVVEGQKFAEWFDAQGFKNFSSNEFTSYFNRSLNTTPPSSIWTNIVPTLRIVDELCDVLQTKIRITSSYRNPAYNRSVGGANNSFHSKFMALDIQASGASPIQMHNILKSWRNQGKFRGGLGLYSSFVHIDTRGYNTSW
jgi:uncharacterized protein YcbK (DUF882 family)